MDDREILVGISMLCYNHGPFLRKCLDSILTQKVNFRYQVVIGEDCSTDNSREILKEYEEKYPDIFVMVYNEKNMGGTWNDLNIQKYVQGKYRVGGETDDFWTDEYRLQKQVDFLETHPEYVAVGSNYYSTDPSGEVGRIDLFPWQVNRSYELKDFLKWGLTLHGNTLMYRNVLPFTEKKYAELRKIIPTMGDVITRTLLYDKGNIFVLPDIMHAHRSGATTPSSFSYSNRTRAIEYSYMYCKMVNTLEEYFDCKYDLGALKANRTAGMMILKYVHKYQLDKKEYKKYFKSLDKKTARKAKRRFLQKIFRAGFHKFIRIFNKKYRMHKIDG